MVFDFWCRKERTLLLLPELLERLHWKTATRKPPILTDTTTFLYKDFNPENVLCKSTIFAKLLLDWSKNEWLCKDNGLFCYVKILPFPTTTTTVSFNWSISTLSKIKWRGDVLFSHCILFVKDITFTMFRFLSVKLWEWR